MNIPALPGRGKVDVLGRLFVDGEMAGCRSRFILMAPPRIESVKLTPRLITVGPMEEISVSVTDDQLSGVAHVEAGFDPAGIGQLGPLVPPKILVPDDSGHWIGKLPTKELTPGNLTLLVHASDKVGNISEYLKVKCRVLTPEEAKAADTGGTVHLIGFVFYGEDPVPDAKVFLTNDKGVACQHEDERLRRIQLPRSPSRQIQTQRRLPPPHPQPQGEQDVTSSRR